MKMARTGDVTRAEIHLLGGCPLIVAGPTNGSEMRNADACPDPHLCM